MVIVPPNFEKYRECSEQVHEIMSEFDPNFTSISLDEASLDITTYLQTTQSSAEDAASLLREKIQEYFCSFYKGKQI